MIKYLILLTATLATLNSYAQNNCGTEDLDSATVVNLP
jgi:hypothetical protein